MTFATTNYKACAGSNWSVSFNTVTNSTGGPAIASARDGIPAIRMVWIMGMALSAAAARTNRRRGAPDC